MLIKSLGSHSIQPAVSEGLLKEVGRPIVLQSARRFVAREGFTFQDGPGLRLARRSVSFMMLIEDVEEENVRSAVVQRYTCRHAYDNEPILGELGGADKAKIALVHLRDFLKDHADPKENCCFFIAVRGVFYEVDAHYDRPLRVWDLQQYPIPGSTVLKDIQTIVSPIRR